MVRSSKCVLKFSNTSKLNLLDKILEDYKSDLSLYIQKILDKTLPLKNLLSTIDLPESIIKHSRWKQIIYKQASEIIRSNMEFTKKRVFSKYKKLYKTFKYKEIHTQFTDKKFSELNINFMKRIKINLKNVTIPLDERIIDSSLDSNYFDEFIRIKSPYFHASKKRAITVNIPVNYNKHYNKFKDWNRRNTVFLKKENKNFFAVFMFEKDDVAKLPESSSVGIDLGVKKLISSSSGNKYGLNLESIYKKLANKKRGSKKYQKALKERTNETNRAINLFLNTERPSTIFAEDLYLLRNESKLSHKTLNVQQYFIYSQVLNKLEYLSESKGFRFIRVNPAYTSQVCSNCGALEKSNRKGEVYQCKHCGCSLDADFNASLNILRRGAYSPPSAEKLK